MVRAKFTCVHKAPASEGSDVVEVRFQAVNRGDASPPEDPGNPYSAEDSVFGRFTPYANLMLGIRNPAASDQFEVGKDYYADFTPVEG